MASVHKECKETVHLTPPKIIALVTKHFGGQISLDPATEPNNPTGAATFYTEKDNCLILPWLPNTFVNPPYGRDLPLWVEKIATEVALGHPTIALLPAGSGRPGTKYWQKYVLNSNLRAICYTRGPIAFLNAAGVPQKNNTYPSYFFGYNVDFNRFLECFGTLGKVLRVTVEN